LISVDILGMIVDDLGIVETKPSAGRFWEDIMPLGILNRLRVLSSPVLFSALLLPAGAAQVTTSKGPTFEVASVKVNKSGPAGTKIEFQPKRVNLVNV